MKRLNHGLVMNVFMLLFLFTVANGLAQEKKKEDGGPGLSVFDINLSSTSFNPSRGDKVTLRYQLSRSATVTIKIYDPDRTLVRTLAEKVSKKAGNQTEIWDGKDMDGKIVPNEAYFFTIEAQNASQGQQVTYDPITFSGGESFDITDGKFDRMSGTVTYKLSQPSRVLIRIGIPGSALLKTLVDWEPRIQGEITEYWDGKDEDSLIDVWNKPNFRALITYFTLPESSVITYGNGKYSYREYKSNLKLARPIKEERPQTNLRKISPHFFASRINDRAFKAVIDFPELNDQKNNPSVPTVKNQAIVRIDADEKDREIVLNQQYEIILFIDGTYHVEEEKGYLPFNLPLDLAQVSEGEHVLTVNIVTFGNQIGVGSRKVKVVK